MSGAAALPQLFVMNALGGSDPIVWYKKQDEDEVGSVWVINGKNSVFDPLAKIEAERAKINTNYVHLRFCYSNRYWKRATEGGDIYKLVAESTQPTEDTSDPSCTLFEPFLKSGSSDVFYFKHVPTGSLLRSVNNVWVDVDGDATTPAPNNYFKVVDFETLVQLPEHVAFKGDNGMYLQSHVQDEQQMHMQFSSTDANSLQSGHQIEQMPDGRVRISSDYFRATYSDTYKWFLGDIWIYGDSKSNSEVRDFFWPVKIDENTIALRSLGNNNFCKRYSGDGKTDVLAATVSNITKEAKLQVEELVLDRKIYYVDYRMEDARIFDEQPYLAGTALLVNATDNQTSESVTITYQDEKSYTFSRGMSMTAGVTTSFKAGVPFIAEGDISISFEISGNFQWDTTTTTTTSVAATGTVEVPPRSSVIVEYVGTRGSCNIPYSYTQLDKSATDGKVKRNEMTDGTYTGVSCYNFSFKMSAPQSII